MSKDSIQGPRINKHHGEWECILKLPSLASLMHISRVGNSNKSHGSFRTEMWQELLYKLRHGPLLWGRRPWDKWEVLKHLSVAWLFLISISETHDPNNRSVCELWWICGGCKVDGVRESMWSFLTVFTTCRWSACPLKTQNSVIIFSSTFFQETLKLNEWMDEVFKKDTKAPSKFFKCGSYDLFIRQYIT